MSVLSELAALTRCSLAWRDSATPAGRLWSVLTTLERPTEGSGSGLWPTVRSTDGDRGGRGDLIQAVRGNENSHFKPMFPTPSATPSGTGNNGCPGDGREEYRTKGAPSLYHMARHGLWPTPTSSDHKGAASPASCKKWTSRGTNLPEAVQTWATPTVNDAKNNAAPSQMERNSQALNVQAGGSLNPTWVEWLMGYPDGWTDLEDSEIL